MPGARSIGVPKEEEIRAAVIASQGSCDAVRVMLGDDVVDTIAVSKGNRRRASQLLEALSKCGAWTVVKLLDKQGRTIATVANDGEPGSIEDLGGAPSSGTSSKFNEWERIARIIGDNMIRAQREVITMRRAELEDTLAAQTQMLKEVGGAMHSLAILHGKQMDLAMDAAEYRAELASKDWVQQATELAEAAPQLAPMVQLLFRMFKQPQPVGAGANGAAKAAGAAKSAGANGASKAP